MFSIVWALGAGLSAWKSDKTSVFYWASSISGGEPLTRALSVVKVSLSKTLSTTLSRSRHFQGNVKYFVLPCLKSTIECS